MNGAKTFKKLLEPLTIGRLNLPNRMVMAPMGTALCDPDGLVTDAMREYYKTRAKGGVGMVIVEIPVSISVTVTPFKGAPVVSS